MGSPSAVLTLGFGSWGSIGEVVTLGFGQGESSTELVGTWTNVALIVGRREPSLIKSERAPALITRGGIAR